MSFIGNKGLSKVFVGNDSVSKVYIGNVLVYKKSTTTNYTITNTLSNCSTDNPATQIASGSSYSATITAYSEYTLINGSAQITMGGVNITSTVYNEYTGVIYIPNVTGNIVIDIVANYQPTTFPIYNNLTYCVNTNPTYSVAHGDSYSATIIADTDYTFNGALIDIRMGGLPVSYTFLDDYTIDIYIPFVDNSIDITIEAIYEGAGSRSGLYQNGQLVMSWQQIKDTYPDAFAQQGTITGLSTGSYLAALDGDLVIDAEIDTIGANAFRTCASLTSVEIPSSVITIGSNAFTRCTALTTLKIKGNNLTSIATGAFSQDTLLANLYIDSVEAWCGVNLTAITSHPFSASTFPNHLYVNNIEVTNLTIPNTITSIGNYQFCKCNNLQNVYIYPLSSTNKPSSYTNAWFRNCSSSLILHIPVIQDDPATDYGTYWNYYGSGTTLTYYADLTTDYFRLDTILSNCSMNNTNKFLLKSGSYSYTITPSNNYTLDTSMGANISITLDGSDITSSVYNFDGSYGYLNLYNVNGNVLEVNIQAAYNGGGGAIIPPGTTITFSGTDFTNPTSADASSVTFTDSQYGVTINVLKSSGGNFCYPNYLNPLRIYQGNEMIITVPSGNYIDNIYTSASSKSYKFGNLTFIPSASVIESAGDVTITPNSNTSTIQITKGTTAARLNTIAITVK